MLFPKNKDCFELEMVGDYLVIRGNNPGSMAVGLNYYLREYCNTSVSWYNYNSVAVPEEMPKVKQKVRHEAKAKDRFFLNYCTFGYSFTYWDWPRWERLIDWMALNGVNMPLAITGQEAIWAEVWRDMGMEEQEVLDYFTGPGHLPWQRMGNIDYYDGPLTREWIDAQAELQKKIIDRERAFGMKPVLSAFAGHVPEKIAKGRRHYSCNWNNSDIYRTHFIYPTDPLFFEIQKRYLSAQEKLFGTDHLYAADLFNEMPPPSFEPDSLANISSRMFQSLENCDNKAEWIQMGWMFLSSKDIWTPERISAYLKAVPAGRVKILDYRGEKEEVWKRTEKLYGTPFIWCYLGNFGGNTMLEGCPEVIDGRVSCVLNEAENCTGIGCTPEGLDVNQEVYEYVFDCAWSFHKSPSEWITDVADTHFGRESESFRRGWKMMLDNVLFTYSDTRGTLTNLRPYLIRPTVWTGTCDYFYPENVIPKILDLMLKETSKTDIYAFDVVNLTRQMMGNLFARLKTEYAMAVAASNIREMENKKATMLELMDDLDCLLMCRREFSLKDWVDMARLWGEADDHADEYALNALHLVTIWYDQGKFTLDDYANRNYSGLTKSYYKQRWLAFFDEMEKSFANGKPFDSESFDSAMWQWELTWCNEVANLDNLEDCRGDAVEMSRKMYRKYAPMVFDSSGRKKINRFARTEKYAYENALTKVRPKAVFIGDSITENWQLLDRPFFDRNNFAGRGISGQTSAQLLARIRQDVLALRPEYVVILIGINDFAKNNGEIPAEDILANVKSICDLSRLHGIKPVLCSITPCKQIGWLPDRVNISEEIKMYNSSLKRYAQDNGYIYVDYYSPLSDTDGGLRDDYKYDEVHVNVAAYKKMEEIILSHI